MTSSNPEIVDLGRDRRSNLSPEKRELLKLRLRGRDSDPGAQIGARPKGENPLSFGQERIWIQCQTSPNVALFNIPLLADIAGPLNVDALQRSLDAIIRRHEVLRSGFKAFGGAPRLFLRDDAKVVIKRETMIEGDSEARRNSVRALAMREALEPFDLAHPPLMRARLVTLGDDRHALILIIHHIIWDGWSSMLFAKELSVNYASALKEGGDIFEPLQTQYTDFAYWQRKFMGSTRGAAQIDFWTKSLNEAADAINLPLDHARAGVQAHRGAHLSWREGADLRARLSALAQRSNTTLFVVLLAAYNLLLSRYCGQNDISVGTTIAYRARPELEDLIGFFTNALVLRTVINEDGSFAELIRYVHRTAIEAQDNQDTPFEILVERLAAHRSLSANPLFQVAFVYHSIPDGPLAFDGLTVSVEELRTGSATFDLVLHVFNEDGFRLEFEYDADLFDVETIRALRGSFSFLLDVVCQGSETRIRNLPCLCAARTSDLLSFGAGAALKPGEQLLHQFLEQADSSKAAILTEGSVTTYASLRTLVNQIAHALQRRGVRAETPVGVSLEPSVGAIAAMFGVLQAGGAFVPLDPSYPSARLQYMLDDSGAKIIVTSEAHAAQWKERNAQLLLVDSGEVVFQPSSDTHCPARPDNLAYIVYTSGSTGNSKGVMVTHRNAVASTLARKQFYERQPEGFLLLSSISFDSAFAGVFWSVAASARLCILSEAARRDPSKIVEAIAGHRLTHLLCLPSLYSALLDILDATTGASLRCCIVAGEALRDDLTKKHFGRLPQAELYNEYGPTECAVWSSAHHVTSLDFDRPIPIGAPIAGSHIAVMTDSGDLSAYLGPGELCIAGAGVARGYRGRPDLTADRFRPDPMRADGGRLYRSGDRARWRESGELIFLGRIDGQAKVRGYRVDPEEIENLLLRESTIAEAAVVVRGEGAQARIIAYLVTSADAGLAQEKAETVCRAELPGFMTPDLFVTLPALPRQPNGKVDRRTLPAPEESGDKNANGPLRTVGEFLLGEIWCDVLELESVARKDNFFDIGGNSLSAIQVVARAQQLLGVEVPIAAIFERGTLEAFAREVTETVGEEVLREKAQALLAHS